MGLFTPKISTHQRMYVEQRLIQLQDSVRLVNTTTNPEVFFKRLNFVLDILLGLQAYEKYKIFTGSLPSKDYEKILDNLEATVDDFINRAVKANEAKVSLLKTEAARKRNTEKFYISLIAAFDCAHSFWHGDRGTPHYSGPLFTAHNYSRVEAMFYSLDEYD